MDESGRAGRWHRHPGELFNVKASQRRKFCGQLRLRVPRDGIGDERICAGIGQNAAYFIRLQEIVQGHDHAASPQDAENGGDEFGRVLQPQPDAVARLDPVFILQSLRQPPGLGVQFFVGILSVAPENRGFSRMFLRACSERSGKIHGR